MTTGRINQVTILTEGGRATRRGPPGEGGQSSSPEVEGTATSPGPEVPGAEATQVPPGPSSFSHRVPQRAGRHTDDQAATGRRHGVRHTPPRRRIPAAGHVRDGYLPGLSPECVRITMAIGQQSTGSTDACRATRADRTSVAFAIPIRAPGKAPPGPGPMTMVSLWLTLDWPTVRGDAATGRCT
jgi:hypothetical protein